MTTSVALSVSLNCTRELLRQNVVFSESIGGLLRQHLSPSSEIFSFGQRQVVNSEIFSSWRSSPLVARPTQNRCLLCDNVATGFGQRDVVADWIPILGSVLCPKADDNCVTFCVANAASPPDQHPRADNEVVTHPWINVLGRMPILGSTSWGRQ